LAARRSQDQYERPLHFTTHRTTSNDRKTCSNHDLLVPTLPLTTAVSTALDRRAATVGLPQHSCSASGRPWRPFGRVFGRRTQDNRCPVCDAIESLSRR
jgi:hypothetical protein